MLPFLAIVLMASCGPTQPEVAAEAPPESGQQESSLSQYTGSLVDGRTDHTTTLLADGRILVVGGQSGSFAVDSVELYDPMTGAFTVAARLPVPRQKHSAVRLADGRVLVVGGGQSSLPEAAAFIYQPSTNTWDSAGSLSTPRLHPTATLLADGRVLVVGGSNDSTPLSSVELFDPATGAWTAGPALSGARSNHTATLLPNGTVLVSSGFGGPSPQLFDSASNTWSSAGTQTTPRYGHQAIALADGRVLLAGGIDPSTFATLSSAELYTPSTNTWAPTGSMSAARYLSSSALLSSGKVFVFGGYVGSSYVASVERFDPATGTWSAADPMKTTRGGAGTALFASGDRVLLVGGLGGSSASAEIYTDGACVPTTCAAQGKTCGTISNQCGGKLTCGTCSAGELCLESFTCAPVPAGFATFDATLKVPHCTSAGTSCDSGTLLVGRGPLGPEANAPNTLGASCADGTYGIFHNDESLDRLKVSTLDGSPLAPGKQVRIEATVWNDLNDRLDLYVTANPQAPGWVHVATLTPTTSRGNQTLSAITTLPAPAAGPSMAVRGVFRSDVYQSPCLSNGYRDHDDLAFLVDPSSYDAPPSVQVSAPSANTLLTGNVQVQAQAIDDRGIARVEFFAGQTLLGESSAAPYTLTWATTTVANGYYDLTARAYDSAGQTATSAAVSVRVGNDRTAPTVQVTRPSAGQNVGRLLDFSSTASDDVGITTLEAYLDGVRIGSTTVELRSATTWGFTWDSSQLTDGPHVVYARAYDGAGRMTDSTPVEFIADNTVPTLIINSPIAGASVEGFVQVGIEAADVSGVQAVYLTVDGQFMGSDTSAPFGFTWDSRQAAPGTHTLQVEARDTVGNTGSVTMSVVVTPDTVPPTVSITSPQGGAQVSGIVSVAASASDDRKVSSVELLVDGTRLGILQTATPTFSWNTQTVANGAYRLVARAYDAAGNVTSSSPVDVTVDNPAVPPSPNASYDSTRRAPGCAVAGAASCDSGSLLMGRGSAGPEVNAPNTLGASCSDGMSGSFHGDESLDRLMVSTLDGSPLAAGKTVRIDATVWAWGSGSSDALDLYYAADASAPQWVRITTLVPPGGGQQVLSTTYTLPAGGSVQAIRGLFRYGAGTGPCVGGSYNDHDDLFFAVR